MKKKHKKRRIKKINTNRSKPQLKIDGENIAILECSPKNSETVMSQRMETFKLNNPNVVIEEIEQCINVNNCWNDNSFYFKFDNGESLDFLENLVFPKELFAIYHKDKGLYEFIFLPQQNKYERSFTYTYCGKTFQLYYGTPTSSFEALARHYKMNDSDDITDRTFGLLRFSNFYKNNLEEKENLSLTPINFFIEGDFNDWDYSCHIKFFKHVNFMLSYYDRKSPTILIFKETEEDVNDIKQPCKSNSSSFPSAIYSIMFDTTLLELMEAAKETNSYRLKYIFYFQVLEYCSYYYIEHKFKQQITNIIKSPDILNADKYSNKIIEIYSGYFKSNKDEKRMERLLIDFCTYDDIKDELKVNSKYFIDDICFEGGFTIKKLFKTKEEIDNPPLEIINVIRKNIESIRNVLVHARESRENVEIKPTPKNAKLIIPYLYLLRRIAETVVIKYN